MEIFNYLDVNSDGKVELKEFVTGSLRDKELVGMLKRKGDVKPSTESAAQPPPDVCVVLVDDDQMKAQD